MTQVDWYLSDIKTVVLLIMTNSTHFPLINTNSTVPSGAYAAKFAIRNMSTASGQRRDA